MALTAESHWASLLRASMGPSYFHVQCFFTESLAGSETLGTDGKGLGIRSGAVFFSKVSWEGVFLGEILRIRTKFPGTGASHPLTDGAMWVYYGEH